MQSLLPPPSDRRPGTDWARTALSDREIHRKEVRRSCNTISPLDGADGGLPLSTLNHFIPEKKSTGSYEKIRSRTVLQSVLHVDAAVPCFTLKTYVQARYRDLAQWLND